MLTSDILGGQHPVAQQIFQEKVLSSHRQNKSLLSRIMIEEGREIPVKTKSGLLIGECYTAEFDLGRAIEMFSFIIRGLYFRLRTVVLPENSRFDIRRLLRKDFETLHGQFFETGCNGPYTIGNDVFWCVYNYGAQNEFVTLWLLVFYGRVAYSVVTMPEGYKLTTGKEPSLDVKKDDAA